jgi:hypothetical protein
MLGVHSLRSCAQSELAEGSETKTRYLMMLLGELLGDVFLVMQATLKVPIGILLIRPCSVIPGAEEDWIFCKSCGD